MLTLAIILQWSIITCDPAPIPNPKPECVATMATCLLQEYRATNDADNSYERCSESLDPELLGSVDDTQSR